MTFKEIHDRLKSNCADVLPSQISVVFEQWLLMHGHREIAMQITWSACPSAVLGSIASALQRSLPPQMLTDLLETLG